ncbi:MAG: radical SAM protein [Desulfuromonas sp.]|uniref:B12-binding domain-containing radical SAM protein n=1 Tax=Desulfuromonas sp. TaxID=892 RepID=UPI000CB1B001|nr:cobalamin-dependent protein [Desulfuromonas sp.]PLX86662.1 MAG: radical SAM protein [Desulfuromonas sp.]
MNVALVFPPFYHPDMYNLPPLGLMSLGTVLRRRGHRVALFDMVLALRQGRLPMGPDLYGRCARMILDEEPDLVAFSTQCTTYPPTLQIAERVRRERPQARIVLGGHNASFVAGQTLEAFPCIDAVVRGEGEVTFAELAGAYAAGRGPEGIAGVSWRRGKAVEANPERDLIDDLDTLPLPDYRLAAPLEEYRRACGLPRSIAILEVGRGCPHACVYCSESVMWRRRTRTYSVERLVGEMRQLREEQGAGCFLLAYDQFTAERSFVEAFCRRVLEENLVTPWYCISRLDSVDAELLSLMREAGCESMCYGIDSGSKKTLAFIRKRIDPGILPERVRQTTEQGMVPTLSFVIGFPEEERRDIDATLTLALETGSRGDTNPLLQLPTVLPGTELQRRYGQRLVRSVDTYFSLGIEFDDGRRLAADERLIDAHPALFGSFFNLPCPGMELEELDLLARHFPLVVNLYPRSFLLLCLALEISPSVLFGRFLETVRRAGERTEPSLNPADCDRHFGGFAARLLKEAGEEGWAHLAEVVAYESRVLDVARFASSRIACNIDLCRLDRWRPQKPKNVLLAGFRYNLPAIVADLREGRYPRDYPQEPVWLVFRQGEDELEVTEVNDFGRDLLDQCTGEATVDEIAARLYPRYGREMERAEFFAACREAAGDLSELKFLTGDQPPDPTDGREVVPC